MTQPGTLHHVELWVPAVERAVLSWGWLLTELGYTQYQDWPAGRSWRLGPTYIVVEQSRDLIGDQHERRRPGLNHLAFHVTDESTVDTIVAAAPGYGWRLLFGDRHPYAGGPDQYAAYLEDVDGYEAELVAIPRKPTPAP